MSDQIKRSEAAGLKAEKKPTSNAVKFIKTMFSRRIVIVGAVIFIFFVFMAVAAPLVATHDPAEMNYKAISEPPSAEYILGTDAFGRDNYSRIVYGARISLIIGVVAVFIAAIVGITLGMISAYFGGILDVLIMRCMEALGSIPSIMVSLALIAVIGNTIGDLAVVLSITTIPSYVRMTR